MKTKMKKKCVKILTTIICMFSLVSAILIAPSADTYDDNFTHYRFSYEYSHSPDLSSYVSDADDLFYFIIESPIQQKVVFNDPSTNTSYTYYFTDLAVSFTLIAQNEETRVSHTLLTSFQLNPHGTDEIFLSTNTYFTNREKLSSTFSFRSPDVNFSGSLVENGPSFVIDLWLDVTYVSNVYSRKTDGTMLYANDFVPLFTNSSVVSRPRTYTEGYEFGKIVGREDGYLTGRQEGHNIGFNTGRGQGYNEGYSVGVTDGYADGFENGKIEGSEEGYQNGFDAGYDTGYDDGYLEGKNDQTPVIPDGSKQDLLHLWLYFNANYLPALTSEYEGIEHIIFFDAPFYMYSSLIYGRNGDQNLFKTISFKKLAFKVDTGGILDNGVNYTTRDVFVYFDTDYKNGTFQSPKQYLRINKEWRDGVYQGMTVSAYGLDEYGIDNFNIEWDQSYGNYNLQLWIATDYVSDSLNQNWSSGDLYLKTFYQKFFTYKVISYPKTYNDGYLNGFDFGLEEGYGNGYDQGNIDGIQHGIQEGIQQGLTEGYNEGYDHGYSDGNADGYSLGYDEGELYGWQNGFGAGQNDMAETSHTFKEMVFAIFDAPSRLIDSMLNFDIFGINLAGLVKTIITLAVVAVILVILLKWLL